LLILLKVEMGNYLKMMTLFLTTTQIQVPQPVPMRMKQAGERPISRSILRTVKFI
jgi:hypothetical protein